MRVYYDRDADVNLIKTKKVAIIGYGYMGVIRRRVVELCRELELSMICEIDFEKLVGYQKFTFVRDSDKTLC